MRKFTNSRKFSRNVYVLYIYAFKWFFKKAWTKLWFYYDKMTFRIVNCKSFSALFALIG